MYVFHENTWKHNLLYTSCYHLHCLTFAFKTSLDTTDHSFCTFQVQEFCQWLTQVQTVMDHNSS